METNQISSMLTILLATFIVVLFVLLSIYIILLVKNNKKEKNPKEVATSGKTNKKENKKTGTSVSANSVYDFMEFEDIQDNMIIQKENFKYIMVVECQGINYDLMSEVEKTGVEEGFLQFLNTLRHPVQLYIQTRTINLEQSINTYKSKVNDIEREYIRKRQEYSVMQDNPSIPEETKKKKLFELVKQTNLFEYGKDIILDTEKMSLNRNILNKKYYVIIPYYPSDLGDNNFDSQEIRSLAFSELYTRSQAAIRTLSSCNVQGRILNSLELVDLLYVAYNRDHEEEFNLNRALSAQYDKLYSTSEDIYQKRIRALDKKIEDLAIEKAKNKIEAVKSESEKEAIEKEKGMDNLIDEIAKIVLEANKEYVGEDVAEAAIEKIDEESKQKKINKEGKENAKKEGTRTRRTRKQEA